MTQEINHEVRYEEEADAGQARASQESRKAGGKSKEEVRLTPKQEAFARAYMEVGNASEAYRLCYDVSENAKPEGVWVDACKLLANPKVALRVEQLQREARERHKIDIDTITQMLREDRELARKEGQSSAAVSAVMGLAKIHGLIVDKSSNENKNTGTVSITWAE